MGQTGPIQGGAGLPPSGQVAQNKEATQELIKLLQQSSQETMLALTDLKEELANKISIKDPNKNSKKDAVDQKKDLSRTHDVEDVAAAAADQIETQEDIEKKKRKRKKFDENMKLLASILETIDTSELEEEDEQEIESFKKNMNRMNQLGNELKLVEREIEYLENLQESYEKDASDPASNPKIP